MAIRRIDTSVCRQQLRDLLAHEQEFHLTPQVRDDDALIKAGVLDSFGMITLVILIEQAFDIQVTPEEMTAEHFRSIASIAAYIEGKLHADDGC
jgi:acyl carrier protein